MSAYPGDGANGSTAPSDFFGIFAAIWSERKKIFLIMVGIVAISTTAAFLWPKTFTAETTILPDLDFLSSIGNLGGFKDLATAAGLNLNMAVTSPSQLYPDIMGSEVLSRKIIYTKYKTQRADTAMNLIEYFGIDDDTENGRFEKMLKKLNESIIDISVDKKTLIISLDVSTPEAQLSADIANTLTSELDNFQRNFRRTHASEQRKFLEGRLAEVKQAMAAAEDTLKRFRERNRNILQSAELSLQQDRLSREVDLNSGLFLQLEGQYESARLDEVKNTPVVQVLDVARPPAKKSKPKRILVILACTVLGGALTVGWYGYGKMYLRDLRSSDDWHRVQMAFGRQSNGVLTEEKSSSREA